MLYTLRFFFSSKCSLFHNANLFGSCISQILYTGCAEIKKKNSGAKGLTLFLEKARQKAEEILEKLRVVYLWKRALFGYPDWGFFPCSFLSCKVNASVKPAKTGHGPHSSKFLCCSTYCFVSFCVLFVFKCVLYYCHRVATQLQSTNISYHLMFIGPCIIVIVEE